MKIFIITITMVCLSIGYCSYSCITDVDYVSAKVNRVENVKSGDSGKNVFSYPFFDMRIEYGELLLNEWNVIKRFADERGVYRCNGDVTNLIGDFFASYTMCLMIFKSLEGINNEAL